MSAPLAAIIRRARQDRDWSFEQAARALKAMSPNTLPLTRSIAREWKRWEAGENRPGRIYRPFLAPLLDIDRTILTGIEPDPDQTIPDSSTDDMQHRLALTVASPRRADDAVVAHFTDMLSIHRHAEDELGAQLVIRPTLAEVELINGIGPHAREPVLTQLVKLASEYAQFAGWMSTDLDRPEDARYWYEHAMEWAQEAANTDMVVSVLSMKSHEAWSRGDTQRALALARAGMRQARKTSPGVRSLMAQQAARANAMAGNADETERLLDLAADLAERAARDPQDEPPWIYFHSPDRIYLQRGIAYTELGDGPKAVTALERGVATLPPELVRDRAWGLARLANAYAVNNDIEAAAVTAAEAVRITANGLDSAHALTELRKVRKRLTAHDDSPAVQQLDELLHDVDETGTNS